MKRIPIFYAVDDNYVDVLKVSMHSLIENRNKNRKYSIYVLYTSLTTDSRNSILKLKTKGVNILFFNVSAQIQILSEKLNVRDYYTMTTYYRLILPNAFPYLKKALYIDCDTVLLGDVSELYDTDIGNNLVGAVPDTSVQLIEEFSNYVEKALKVKRNEYFNAGVLIMNFEELRRSKFERTVIELVKTVSFIVAQDQDLLNVICNNKVHYLGNEWNQMPIGEKNQFPKLIHYNLIYKPWKQYNIMYEDYFWLYAKELNLHEKLMAYRDSISEEKRKAELDGVESVKRLCVHETKRKNYYKKGLDTVGKLSMSEREQILAKIAEYEKAGTFDIDVENDPPYRRLRPGDVDYLHKSILTKFNTLMASHVANRFFNRLIRKGQIVIDDVVGIENLKKCKTGAVITANHFNPFDSIPIQKAVKRHTPSKKLYTVIREGNFTFPGLYGRFMRYCNTLPLASNIDVMKQMMYATDYYLKKGNFVLVYAEQSMWWNYRKPKPVKPGAFRFACISNVPVIPTFITMRDLDKKDQDGYPIQAYTLHILKPIYPDANLNINENVKNMMEANNKAWKEIYEKVYGIPLTYTTVKK